SEAEFVFEQGGDVIEQDSLLRKIRDFADEFLQRLAIRGALCLHVRPLPGSLYLECVQIAGGLAGRSIEFVDRVDPRGTWAFIEASFERRKFFGVAGGEQFDGGIFIVAHPADQPELAGFTLDEPAEADSLDSSSDDVSAGGHFDLRG